MFGDVLLDPGIVLSQQKLDLSSQFLAWREFGFGQVRQGHLPLWNPHIFSGAPYLGGFQSALLYPPNWVHIVMPVGPAINLLISLHIFLLGLFTYFWASRRGLHPLAATLAGALLMFSGTVFLHIYAGHLPNIYCMAWTPLLILSIDGVLEERKLRWVLVGIATVALQILAGHPQYVFVSGLTALVYWTLRVTRINHRLWAMASLTAIYAGGAAVAAAQLLPGAAAAAESLRGKSVPFEFATMFSFPPENLITLAVPGFFGDMIERPYWGRWYLWEMSLFIGITGLLLAIYGASAGDRRQRFVDLAMVVMLFVLALGIHTPLFHVLYRFVPGFNEFRGTSKFTFPMTMFLTMLAGTGLDRLVRSPGPRIRLTLGALIAATILATAGAMVWHQGVDTAGWWPSLMNAVRQTREPQLSAQVYGAPGFTAQAGSAAAEATLWAATTFLALAGLLYCLKFGRLAAYAITILGLVEVFTYAHGSRATFRLADIALPEVERYLADRPGDYRVLNMLQPNGAMSTNGRDIWGYDPGVPRRYAEFMAFTQGLNPDDVTQYVVVQKFNPLYRMLRLKYAIGLNAEGGTHIVETPNPMPHVTLVTDYRIRARRAEVFAELSRNDFDPSRTVILESAPGFSASPVSTQEEPGNARVVEESTDGLTVQADVAHAAILLITDSYSRDWHARPLPGSAQSTYEILPANYILMAVPLTAGHHVIRLEYAPRAFLWGKWISLTSLAGFLGVCVFVTTRHRA